ncbi:PilN domain-containing protein [Megasphaera vaginalis (ex Srinivasan et al. 2021)]|nr:PilN domain-containing protein [Megasphaera vaginalis (ex Srinivasan et al. 2021)]
MGNSVSWRFLIRKALDSSMRFDLTERENGLWEKKAVRYLYSFSLYGLIIALLLLATANGVLYCRICKQKQVYEAYFWPNQQKIEEQNAALQTVLDYSRKVNADRGVHWSALLVSLAETRPSSVTVTSLQADKGKLLIEGRTPDRKALTEWQGKLRQLKAMTNIALRKTANDKNGNISFSMEGETFSEGKNEN